MANGQRFNVATLNIAHNFHDMRTEPAYEGFAVTPADGTDLSNGPCDALFVTVGGNVNVNLLGGGTAVLTGLVAGQIIPIAAQRVLSTSTTATGIFALYKEGF
jgi:hypothetical protein